MARGRGVDQGSWENRKAGLVKELSSWESHQAGLVGEPLIKTRGGAAEKCLWESHWVGLMCEVLGGVSPRG